MTLFSLLHPFLPQYRKENLISFWSNDYRWISYKVIWDSWHQTVSYSNIYVISYQLQNQKKKKCSKFKPGKEKKDTTLLENNFKY